ncbi:hypothetical protein LguiB_031166 [Lonicera macranthoides]
MEYSYMDEKRRISKEDFYNSNKSNLLRSMSQKSTVVSKSPLLKSFSKNSSFKSSLSRSSSTKSTTTTTKSPLSRSSSQKCGNFTRKCSSLAKEQRAKFYIVKRCITMLVGWKKNGDS